MFAPTKDAQRKPCAVTFPSTGRNTNYAAWRSGSEGREGKKKERRKERRRATATKNPSESKLRCQGSDGQRCGGEHNLAIQG